MKTKLTRDRIEYNNSLFVIDVVGILNVYNESNENLKYLYNPMNKNLTVFGDYREIIISYF